ncbi:MAG: hypothetical protein BWY96_03032 [Spirochaetes bacterium ADurb.BinA120]|nr:MAG: hypothetical protein BWY96_03032 [Spirochaetes bacterium ADurb.BinA120]
MGHPRAARRNYLFPRRKRAVGNYKRVTPAIVPDEHRNASIGREIHRFPPQGIRYSTVLLSIEGEHFVVEREGAVVLGVGEVYSAIGYADGAGVVDLAEFLGPAAGGRNAHEGGLLAGGRAYIIDGAAVPGESRKGCKISASGKTEEARGSGRLDRFELAAVADLEITLPFLPERDEVFAVHVVRVFVHEIGKHIVGVFLHDLRETELSVLFFKEIDE